ncbi:FAD-dependent oxidoreductase [Amycolatopsis aidingensis]|uniref:FAD-dependent oxidoreductase n=1 Tax=Amycolatopsis aidingensis TaxID=2842453 RepID=UPI001E3DC39D|nr:FAD-dependent oxidoreductase [Amycolatopsis aidingensis]
MSGRFVGETRPDVLVLGAGVIGLSTAVCLAEAGHRVRVWAQRLPAETTSAVASGLWVPGLTPRDLEWSRVTLAELSALAGPAGTGVHPEWGLEVSDQWTEPPPWAAHLPEMRPCRPEELPPGMRAGLWARVPMIDLPVYLDFLCARLAEAGADLRRRTVRDLAEAAAAAPVVVNCTGVAAGGLAGDAGVWPVRGQHVVVRNPGVGHFYIEAVPGTEWTGFFPHGDRVLLAGVSQPGNWSLEPDPAVAEGILRRCARIEPRFAGAEVLDHLVGLRPGRESVRLEQERIGTTRVVHNYGHGGEGVSLSWGSARAVERLLAP